MNLNARLTSREPASTSASASAATSTPPPSAAAAAAAAAAREKAAAADALFFSKEAYEKAGSNPDISMEEALSAFDKAFKKARRAARPPAAQRSRSRASLAPA